MIRLRKLMSKESEFPLRYIYKEDEELDTSFNWSQFARLYTFFKPYLKSFVLALIITSSFILISKLLIPLFLGRAVDALGKDQMLSTISQYCLMIAALFVAQWMASIYRVRKLNYIGTRIITDLRQHLFQHMQKLSFRYFDQRPAGATLVRLTNDVNSLQELFTNGIIFILIDLILLIGIIIILLTLNFKLGLAILFAVPIMFLLSLQLQRKIRIAMQDVRLNQSRINAHLNENIQGIRISQAYGQEKENIQYYEKINHTNLHSWNRANHLYQIFGPLVEITSGVGTFVLFFYGAYLIQNGEFTIGLLLAFVTYIGNFWEPIHRLSAIYAQLLVVMSSSERIFELFDQQPDIVDRPNATSLTKVKGDVSFKNVTFEYDPGQPILHGIDLEIEAGKTVALVGHTGSGKSSIINSLCRFYDIQQGQILIDDTDIRDIELQSWRSHLGIVMQEPFIFSGTIKDNIRYGKLDATDKEIQQVAIELGFHEFVRNLPEGYDTQVEERGNSLSVGQKQLISFARAVISDPRILILDEATANIDTESEQLIQKSLVKLFSGRTSIIVAHRLSTIRSADLIVVLDHGRIVEKGSHESLMTARGHYYELVQSQFASS
jgi:ATP-binding cassette subfamily B multidrug efflux pump